MSVRVVSEGIAHVRLGASSFVVRSSPSDHDQIAGAATCLRHDSRGIWLASSLGFLRHLILPQGSKLGVVELETNFLSSVFEAEAFPGSEMAVSLDVGELYSLSTSTDQSWLLLGKTECSCFVEVFGEKGYAKVGVHDGEVKESCDWDSSANANASCLVLWKGRLRNAIVRRAVASPAVVTISASGVIRAAGGASYSGLRGAEKWEAGPNEVFDMCQVPVFEVTDAGNNFAVVIGSGRVGVVLYSGRCGKLMSSAFVLKGSSDLLRRYDIIVVEERDSWVVIEEESNGHRTSFSYNSSNEEMAIKWDCENFLSRFIQEEQTANHSFVLSSLLKGIEDLGEREKGYQADSNTTEELISSYNSALLFVTEWKEDKLARTSRNIPRDSCSARVDFVSAGSSNHLSLPAPMLGTEVFITASFKNNTGIALGEGWMLRLEVEKGVSSESSVQKSNINSPEVTDRGSAQSKAGEVKVCRVMTCPVELVPAGTVKEVSFPFVLESHAPLYMNMKLVFHHPTSLDVKGTPVDIEIVLRENMVLDVLSFSHIIEKEIKDTSHLLLASSQLAQLLNDETAGTHHIYPLVSRFDVPVDPETLRKLIRLASPVTLFKTALGGHFTLSTEIREEVGIEGFSASSVTIRGAPHVLPFVRAAIIRRVIDLKSRNEALRTGITIRSRGNINLWQKTILESGDESLPSLRRAEARLVEALRMFREIEDGSIEHCLDGQARDALAVALQSSKGSYGMWRRQTERLWTPKGAASSRIINAS